MNDAVCIGGGAAFRREFFQKLIIFWHWHLDTSTHTSVCVVLSRGHEVPTMHFAFFTDLGGGFWLVNLAIWPKSFRSNPSLPALSHFLAAITMDCSIRRTMRRHSLPSDKDHNPKERFLDHSHARTWRDLDYCWCILLLDTV
jgi:hypothetical protein